MKTSLFLSLIFSLTLPLAMPIDPALAIALNHQKDNLTSSESSTLIARERGGGGNRGGGNRGGGLNRSSVGANGTGRVNRDQPRTVDRSQRTVNRRDNGFDRSQVGANGSGRINRDQSRTVDRSNINRDRNVNRNVDRNIDRNVNRNIDRNINRNVIVNPRGNVWGGNAWGWNGGRVWYPNTSYWGGGFWAATAITAGVTSAIVNANNNPTYVVIQPNTPGYTLFDSYGLTQVECVENNNQVYIYGPQDSLICANPNSIVSAGYYEVNTDDLTLIAR
jgi:hypothetical protein